MAGYCVVALHDNEKNPARGINVGVTGRQFEWSFQYPPSLTGGTPVESAQLHLPKGESVKFDMHSRDVIHALWIPPLRLQEHLVPASPTPSRLTPTPPRPYPPVPTLPYPSPHP